jgi:hypothetical protein
MIVSISDDASVDTESLASTKAYSDFKRLSQSNGIITSLERYCGYRDYSYNMAKAEDR